MFFIPLLLVTMNLWPSIQPSIERQAGMAEMSAYTGIEFPESSYIVRYSSGWDERYLKLMLDDQEITEILASVNLDKLSGMPREIDGMNPMQVYTWWHPRSLKSYLAYEGTLQGTTNAFGKFFIVVEVAESPKKIVYIYFFKV